jgi:hypothetical protein
MRMPRVEVNKNKVNKFIDEWIVNVKRRRYVGFHTVNNELILVPATSTDPILYAYISDVTEQEAHKICNRAFIKLITGILNWEWSADRITKETG